MVELFLFPLARPLEALVKSKARYQATVAGTWRPEELHLSTNHPLLNARRTPATCSAFLAHIIAHRSSCSTTPEERPLPDQRSLSSPGDQPLLVINEALEVWRGVSHQLVLDKCASTPWRGAVLDTPLLYTTLYHQTRHGSLRSLKLKIRQPKT